jgi:hypothetical protein
MKCKHSDKHAFSDRIGNFYNVHGKSMISPVWDWHMGKMDKFDCMMNLHSISRWPWDWTRKLFFCLLEFTVLNRFVILASCDSKLSHWPCRLTLVRDLIQGTGGMPWTQTTREERQASSISQLQRLDTRQQMLALGREEDWVPCMFC